VVDAEARDEVVDAAGGWRRSETRVTADQVVPLAEVE